MPVIRPSRVSEKDALFALWERSVRASHHFLTEEDILFYRPLVKEVLVSDMEFWTAQDYASGSPLGFMGLATGEFGEAWRLEALFVEPEHFQQGVGTLLVTQARLLKGRLSLDVNEQNPDARDFYRRLGFAETGRSPLDGAGRPFPLIHMFG